ncbi:MAG: LytTR family DNA-binding domain-containing protein [Defluviitaleaceae bacterium]|nr:LytTR family DNA-binding domain-containing protein [Defluviitaleaceae bacterium]MCL2274151.1 LytTR family DNA-binding domain-containing protein [Defluviitaleaceae bacterium]
MYKIAICEDDVVFAQAQQRECAQILDRLHIKHEISHFRSGAALLTAYEVHGAQFDIILMDIMMDGINGIDAAKEIRKNDGNTAIVFITASADFAISGYEANALRYILKPVDAVQLEQLLVAVYAEKHRQNTLTIKTGSQNVLVPVDEIICLETEGRRVKIITARETHIYTGKLTALMDALPKHKFSRCHQSFAINIACIRELSRFKVILESGREIPIWTYPQFRKTTEYSCLCASS